jgi:hypothetical protein
MAKTNLQIVAPRPSFPSRARQWRTLGALVIEAGPPVPSPNVFAAGVRRGLGLDVLGDLNAIIVGAKNAVSNMLPTWAGGQVITANQLANIQSQAQQAIHIASGGNAQLEQQAVAQMLQETSAVASQAQAAAEQSDTSFGASDDLLSAAGIGASGLPSWVWIAAAGAGILLIVWIAKR